MDLKAHLLQPHRESECNRNRSRMQFSPVQESEKQLQQPTKHFYQAFQSGSWRFREKYSAYSLKKHYKARKIGFAGIYYLNVFGGCNSANFNFHKLTYKIIVPYRINGCNKKRQRTVCVAVPCQYREVIQLLISC